MSRSPSFQRVELSWATIGPALALLDDRARGAYRAVPVGNHACIDCADEADTALLLSAFPKARRIAWRPA